MVKNMTRLFVIGNGFDIKHGLNTSFQNFKNEVKKNDLKLFEIINEAEKNIISITPIIHLMNGVILKKF
ncbi:AbiH family protein [Staphylococcus epidermidis]|uniref:AbiH family protein n=2 Tax=Staphylococcus epidermidis TaxID=1282 RepID=UPI0039BFC317